MAIETPPTNLAATLVNSRRAAVLELAIVRVAVAELPIDLLAEREPVRDPAVAPARSRPLDQAAVRELVRDPVAAGEPELVPAEPNPVPGRLVDPVAVAEVAPTGLVIISLPEAAAAALLAAAVETMLGPVAAEEVTAWAAAASAAEAAVAEEEDAAAVVDAGDEQFSNGTKTNEIEIKHHEAIKIFSAGVCDCFVRGCGVCAAGCAGK
jgi:hypothetical protein